MSFSKFHDKHMTALQVEKSLNIVRVSQIRFKVTPKLQKVPKCQINFYVKKSDLERKLSFVIT